MEQTGFFFDAPLEHIPATQIPAAAPVPKPVPPPVVHQVKREDDEAFVQKALVVLETIEDDFDTDDVLEIMGVEVLSRKGWHRARVMEAIRRPVTGLPFDQGPYGPFQARKDGSNMRYRRLPPMQACGGWEGRECSEIVRGEALCLKCRDLEADSLDDTYAVFGSDISLAVGSLIPTDSHWKVLSTATSRDIPDTVDNPSKRYWYRAVPAN